MKNEKKDAKIQKKVETKTKYYSQKNSQGTCPKCKSDNSKYRGSCPVDFTDNGDGEAVFDVFLICKKCGLEFQDIWEARYLCTEGEEKVVVGDVSSEDNDGNSDD